MEKIEKVEAAMDTALPDNLCSAGSTRCLVVLLRLPRYLVLGPWSFSPARRTDAPQFSSTSDLCPKIALITLVEMQNRRG